MSYATLQLSYFILATFGAVLTLTGVCTVVAMATRLWGSDDNSDDSNPDVFCSCGRNAITSGGCSTVETRASFQAALRSIRIIDATAELDWEEHGPFLPRPVATDWATAEDIPLVLVGLLAAESAGKCKGETARLVAQTAADLLPEGGQR